MAIASENGAASRAAIPRVLFVDNQVSDFVQHRMGLAHTLQEAGFEVHVAVPREAGLDHLSREGFRVHLFYIRRMSTLPSQELRCCVSLLNLYRRVRPVLVHHFCLKPALYGGIAARLAGVPAAVSTLTGLGYLYTADGIRSRVLRSLVTGALRFAFRHPNNRVTFQNQGDRDCMLANGAVTPDRAVLIKGSGVNLSRFTPRPESDGPPVVLMASRLLWTKGVGEFVAAGRALRARGIRARFVLLGEPDYGHPSAVALRTLQQWHSVGDVEWLGWRDDMAALIPEGHIVCLPSSYGEGVPRILLEAAACGRPIVAVDSPGAREVVQHDRNGLLVPAGDGDALAGAIARLIGDRALRVAMGARGRQIAVAEFSLELVIDANLSVYRSLLGPRAHAWPALSASG